MPRIVVIGDIHCRVGHPRNAARLAALDQIIIEGSGLEDLGAWVLLGDVFDSRSDVADRNAIAPRVQLMARSAPVVILEGNHDAKGDLEILGRLEGTFPITVIAERPQTVRVRLGGGVHVAAIAGLPYPHAAGLIAAGVSADDKAATASQALADIGALMAAELRAAVADGCLPLLIGHGTIVGARSSVGQPMGLERDIAIDGAFLSAFAGTPKVFGHIHAPQDTIGGAVYAGSIGRNDYGEVEGKRYLVIEYRDPMLHALHSRPLAVTPLWHVEGDLTREAFTYRVTRGPDGEALERPATWAGQEVRCRYRFSAAEKSALDEARILAEFAGAAKLELDPIAVRDRAIRAPQVAAAVTTDDKIAAYFQHAGFAFTDSLQAKLGVLQQPDGAAFLTQVQQAITLRTMTDQMEVVEL